MATPTPNTRAVAHLAVGALASYTTHCVTKKLVGKSYFLVVLAGFVIGIYFHELLDAPLAKGMADVGLKF